MVVVVWAVMMMTMMATTMTICVYGLPYDAVSISDYGAAVLKVGCISPLRGTVGLPRGR
jgi:hypothetical protein